jgi:hypothetical protein
LGSLETKANSRNAGISGLISRFFGSPAKRRNAWLTWEDSNRHIPDLKLPFEISEEFQTFSRKFRPETFGTILPLSGYMETGSKNLVWYLVCARVLRLLKGQY